jgi:hypothetical protein
MDDKIYHYYGKEYVLVNEIVKGGCQGCAFIEKLDCVKKGRTKLCNETHKIFLRHISTDK